MLIRFPEEIREKVESADDRTTTEQLPEQLAEQKRVLLLAIGDKQYALKQLMKK